MRGGLTGDEEFLAWEPYTYLAFRFNSCTNKAIAAFAEEYRVVETPGGCQLTWTMAQKPNGPARFGLVARRPADEPVVQAVPGQPAPLHRQAVRLISYSPAHAARRTASGSSTETSRDDPMTRVARRALS